MQQIVPTAKGDGTWSKPGNKFLTKWLPETTIWKIRVFQ